MPRVRFLPDDREIQVEPGTDLLLAAKRLGISLDAECGGQGTCKACLVRVQQGAVSDNGRGWLPADVKEEGFVLACAATVDQEDVRVDVPVREAAGEGTMPKEQDSAAGPCPDPMALTLEVQVPEPRLLDGLSDQDRLARSLSQTRELAGVLPLVRLDALRDLAWSLRQDRGRVQAGVAWTGQGPDVLRVLPAFAGLRSLGAAVDIGSTGLALRLADLDSGRTLAEVGGLNPQVACGLDVISRINYARRQGGLAELTRLVRHGLARLLRQACDRAGCDPGDIAAVSAAGNTVMTHLWLGLDPDCLRLPPYTPTAMDPRMLHGRDLGLPVHPQAPVEIAPAVGSYVGGDITAGLVQTDIPTSSAVSLYIDIGTNGEAVVGNADFLLACACSAGPAFEGAGLSCGMRAAAGAVEGAAIDPATGEPTLSVIAGGRARGICGSGAISIMAQLFKSGWLDAAGRLDRNRPGRRIRACGRRAEYVLAFDNARPVVTITENDILAVMRAKAAIFAGCRHLLAQVGLEFADVERIIVAGEFGRRLNLEDAVAIGLFPDVDRDRFRFVGNASLAGAEHVLRSRGSAETRRRLAQRITYMDLSAEPGYMAQYTAAMFLPHTEAGLFPGVQ